MTKVSSGNVINDLIKSGSKRCYYFDTSIIANIYNSKLIFNLNLFSGGVILSLNGWKIENDNSIQSPRTSSYSYHVVNDKIILLKKEDFEYFDRLISSNDNNKKLYFCIFGQQMSSYRLSINFLSEVESLQRYNYISPGSELTGFLQGGQVTRYKLLDFTLNQNSIIAFSFTSLEGKVEFFSTFCQEKCEYNDEILKNRIQQGEIILSSEETEKKKSIVIKPEDNRCYKQISIEKARVLNAKYLNKLYKENHDKYLELLLRPMKIRANKMKKNQKSYNFRTRLPNISQTSTDGFYSKGRYKTDISSTNEQSNENSLELKEHKRHEIIHGRPNHNY